MSDQHSICLFGGTFDPIHLGHTYIAQITQLALDIDKVIFLPCHTSPHKLDTQTAVPEHRLNMCQLATENLPWAEVSDYDLTAPTPSFSWKTAEHFKSLYPNTKLYWLMGTDQWNSLDRWGRCEHFAELVSVIVFTRGNDELKQHPFVYDYHILEGSHPASATAIRNWIQNSGHQGVPNCHPKVVSYLEEHQCYQ